MKILLGCDGSAHALMAEELLQKVPGWRAAEIITVSVASLPVPYSAGFPAAEGGVYAGEMVEVYEDIEKHAETAAHAAEERLAAKGLKARAVVIEGTNVSADLLELAKRENVDLIAVGSRGENAVVGFLLGSTTRTLINDSPISVLVARAYQNTEPEETLERLKAKSKLVLELCYDGSQGSEYALNIACDHGPDAFERVLVVCAEPLGSLPPGVDPASFGDTYRNDHEEAIKVVHEAVGRLRGCTHNVKGLTKLGIPKDVLLEIAEDENADLISIGANRHGFLERLLLGSVSYDVATHAPCSVLVARPTA